MKVIKQSIASSIFILLGSICIGQIVSIEPIFPTQDDDITVTYDATKGSMGLVGVNQVYTHTGVITNLSGANEWKYVQGNWGQDDPNVKMTNIGEDKHQIVYNINQYYGVPGGETVEELAFVFRNVDGSKEGKTSDFQDIFVPVYSAGSDLLATFVQPEESVIIKNIGDQLEIEIATSKTADISLFQGSDLLDQANGTSLNHTLEISGTGTYTVRYEVTDGMTTLQDSFSYAANPDINIQNPPIDYELGIDYLSDNDVRLALYAPEKEFVYVLGDFNDWLPDTDYFMNRSEDGNVWWIELGGLTAGEEYGFQYFVDGAIKIADPYSELVLDGWNDGWIPEEVYPDLKPFPAGKTTGYVSVLQTNQEEYSWTDDAFVKPSKNNLIIYELLMRDFLSSHSYKDLRDTLNYLHQLGVNAIELMPVNEFEGNDSWGYNPSYHMALDKYYGTKEDFKEVINTAHNLGMAVILDVVYNHAFGQSPLVRLYWDASSNKPAVNSPWANPDAKHPFNVGYDLNHESTATKEWVKKTLNYWLEEYHIDGFRFDLSKGFTQNFNSDVGAWSNYDGSRVSILKDYADFVWSVDEEAYVILEHFATNSEEKELANYGMLIWGNNNYQYNEATMGYSSVLNGVDYKPKTWDDPNLIGYMESHDEERLMYKNGQWGNSNDGYDITEPWVGIERIALAANFFIPFPGPKMIWQFGELGYGYSINHCPDGSVSENCRLSPKPVRWDYFEENERKKLYDVFAALIHLKKNYKVFETNDYSHSLTSFTKRINLNDDEMNVTILGNFDVVSKGVFPQFQHEGWWYEYFSGDSINVVDVNDVINLEKGEYLFYTDVRLTKPNLQTEIETEIHSNSIHFYPNPTADFLYLEIKDWDLHSTYEIFKVNGEVILSEKIVSSSKIDVSKLSSGIYFVRLKSGKNSQTFKFIKE